MPNSPSAAKRLRQSNKRRMHNRITKKVIKTSMKKAIVVGRGERTSSKAEVDFRAAMAKIDKAGARRVLHPNTAARRKSKLARTYAAALAKAKQSSTWPGLGQVRVGPEQVRGLLPESASSIGPTRDAFPR